ncbi:heterokaryon incompatibility protein-domain-containing protein [Xylaria acuta]|nr:heterokaryon incompatibility protein-domain-containing protein [Xylaria acuta]
MWLIKTDTMQLKYFINPRGVRYAILSHTWGPDEVSFQQFANLGSARHMAGFAKIKRACELANEEFGLNYAWVDTCCIDKSSSAELSEAINSMFAWYRDAAVCLTFLSDLPPSKSIELIPSGLEKCRWFRRGWTLQELLAPRRVEFYNKVWHPVGSKKSLERALEKITGIPLHVLDGDPLETLLVSDRMRWAAMRETTRLEDMAYCLLGIFGINMPLLYGEGDNAFIRLQEEICKQTNDMSLFAWTAKPERGPQEHHETRGVFASHPSEFRCIPDMLLRDGMHSQEVTITSRGVKFNNIELLQPFKRKPLILPLGLIDKSNSEELGIFVIHTSEGYVRPFAERLADVPVVISYDIPMHDVYLRKHYKVSLPLEVISERTNKLELNLEPSHLVNVVEAVPSSSFDYARTAFIVPTNGFVAGLHLRVKGIDLVIIILLTTKYLKFDISSKGYGALGHVDWSVPENRLKRLWARRRFKIDITNYLEHNAGSWAKDSAAIPIVGSNLRVAVKCSEGGGVQYTLHHRISAEFEEYVEQGPGLKGPTP